IRLHLISRKVMEDIFTKRIGTFVFTAGGSAKEVTSALTKAKTRNLVTEQENTLLREKLLSYFRLINAYIKSIGSSKDDDQANTDH
ncbi:MAG TPA: hypothetical protein VGQ53_06165, partial [Chitinophagaceae bacterium]|nr:hypothetical protein [Chitinophagaceae bacterium]